MTIVLESTPVTPLTSIPNAFGLCQCCASKIQTLEAGVTTLLSTVNPIPLAQHKLFCSPACASQWLWGQAGDEALTEDQLASLLEDGMWVWWKRVDKNGVVTGTGTSGLWNKYEEG